jgi:hypothetical protein
VRSSGSSSSIDLVAQPEQGVAQLEQVVGADRRRPGRPPGDHRAVLRPRILEDPLAVDPISRP